MRYNKVVWILNHYAGSRIHGMEYRHFYLAKYFRKMGFNPAIISASFHHLFTNPPSVKHEEIDGIPYFWIKTCRYKKNNLRRVINMIEFSFRLVFKSLTGLSRPDVVITSSPHPFVAINGYLFSQKYRAKFIFEVRDLWPLTLMEVGGYSTDHPFIKIMSITERLAYEHCDYTVSLLGGADSYMVEHGLKKEKFVYIPNGIDLEIYHKNISELPEEHNKVVNNLKQKGNLIILYSGNHGIVNALNNVIEAARSLNENTMIHFLLVGQGPEKQSLMAQAKNYNLKNVTFLDPVSKSKMAALTRAVDVGYIGLQKKDLFKYGVSPNKLFEYMASGLPIVFAINTSYNEVVKAECGYSIRAESPSDLADVLREISQLSKKQLRLIGKKGQEYVKKTHTYEVLAQQYAELF